MKSLFFLLMVFILSQNADGQVINWKSIRENQHTVHVSTGWEYGMIYAAGYSHSVGSGKRLVLLANISLPFGKKLTDDFKFKTGGKIRLAQINSFAISAGIEAIYRRYENSLVRMQNFGAEVVSVAGYYKSRWFIAAEAGFDKAIVLHLKHSDSYKDIYSSVRDGWYEPASGGNFSYGLQVGYSFKRTDLTVRLGKTVSEDFSSSATIPFYAQLGLNYRLP